MDITLCPLCQQNYSRSDVLKRHFKVAHRHVLQNNESNSVRFERYTTLLVQRNTVHLASQPEDNDTNHPPPPPASSDKYPTSPPPPPPPPASSDAYPPPPTTLADVMGMYHSSMDDFYNPLQVNEINSEHISKCYRFILKHPFTAVLARPTMSGKPT